MLAKYCDATCQRNHWPKHKTEIMTLSFLPIYDFAVANVGLEHWPTEQYYSCCGKSICGGCAFSFIMKSGHIGTCAFCKADIIGKTDEEMVEELM